MKDMSQTVYDSLEQAAASPELGGPNRVYVVRSPDGVAAKYVVARSPEQAIGMAARVSRWTATLADGKRTAPAPLELSEAMRAALREEIRAALREARPKRK